jgi:hypothetical protein
MMLNVAPVSTKYFSLPNYTVRKINPAFAGKCMALAMRVQAFSGSAALSDQAQGFTDL